MNIGDLDIGTRVAYACGCSGVIVKSHEWARTLVRLTKKCVAAKDSHIDEPCTLAVGTDCVSELLGEPTRIRVGCPHATGQVS